MSILGWIGTLVLLAQGGGQTTVGALGDPASWELAGVRSFEARDMIGVVLNVGELRVAARAGSPREKFLRLVETSIQGGYQRAGFVQARVTAAPSEGGARLRIQVEEGPQSLAGPVRVEGNQQVASEAIAAALAEIWKPGSPAPADPLTLNRAWRLVASCYAEHGFFTAKGEAALRAEDDARAALVVQVAEEGRASTVTRLQIDGDGDDPAAIAARIGFAPGKVWSTRARQDLTRRLRALGRYLDIELDDQTRDAEGSIDPLRVTLTRAPKLPEWDQMPWEDLALLSRSVAWLRSQLEAGAPVHLHVVHRGEQKLQAGVSLTPGEADLIVSAQGITLSADFLRWRGAPLGEWSVLFTAQQIGLRGEAGSVHIPFEHGRSLIWQVTAQPQPRSERKAGSMFSMFFGFRTFPAQGDSGPLRFEVEVHEAALLSGLCEARVGRPHGGEGLSLDHEDTEVSLHMELDRATAALKVDARFELHPSWTLEVRFPADAATSRPGAATASQPGSRGLHTLLGEAMEPTVGHLLRALGVEDRTSHRLLWVVGRLLVREAGAHDAQAKETQAEFEIPGATGDQGLTLLAARWALGAIAAELSLDSWLRSLLTDVVELWLNPVQDERVAAWESLQRHLRDPRCGPVARWAFAEVLAYANKPEMAALFARSAKTPLDLDAAWQDMAMMAGDMALSAVGAAWARDESPELRALFGADAATRPPLEIANAGFEHLWARAFERLLRDRLRALDR